MDKFRFLILSIIVILIFDDLTEGQTQFSFANEICHTSCISPTQAINDSTEKQLTAIDKILNVPIGIAIGSMCGFVLGAVIPVDYETERYSNSAKGLLIGASMGPFYTFEIMLMSKGVKNPSHKLCFKAGGNITLTNYEDALSKAGYSFGFGRHYHLSDRLGLRGEVSYSLRQFLLPSQKIRYSYYSERVVKCYDIDFSVGYINTSILLNFKLLNLQKFNFYLSLGPSLSLAVRDATKFHFIREEENPDDFDFSYIMDEPGALFGYPAMVYQLELQRGHWIWQFSFHHSVTYTDQIFPLKCNSRLSTFELSIGYKL